MSLIRVGSGEGWESRAESKIITAMDGDTICCPTRGMYKTALQIRDRVAPGKTLHHRSETGLEVHGRFDELSPILKACKPTGRDEPELVEKLIEILHGEGFDGFRPSSLPGWHLYDEDSGIGVMCHLAKGSVFDRIREWLSWDIVGIMAVTNHNGYPREQSLQLQFIQHWPILPYVID